LDKIKYKKIELNISEKVFSKMKQDIIIRKMADNAYGLNDQILIKIVKYITDGEDKVEISYKTERS
jgi:hypothetical protein